MLTNPAVFSSTCPVWPAFRPGQRWQAVHQPRVRLPQMESVRPKISGAYGGHFSGIHELVEVRPVDQKPFPDSQIGQLPSL